MRKELTEKIDHLDFKIDTVSKKVDGVDASLSAKIDARCRRSCRASGGHRGASWCVSGEGKRGVDEQVKN